MRAECSLDVSHLPLHTLTFDTDHVETNVEIGFYLLGMWYKRSDSQRRFTSFFCSTYLAGAFGGLLASAIGNMDGIRGLSAWRWIFILEGLLTCVVGFVAYFTIADFPEQAKWLNDCEQSFIKARLQQDQGKSSINHHITVGDSLKVLSDHKMLAGGLMYFGLLVPAYGFAYFGEAPLVSKIAAFPWHQLKNY